VLTPGDSDPELALFFRRFECQVRATVILADCA